MEQKIESNYTLEGARRFVEENRSQVESTFRNTFHLMPPVGWMNDPNGFIYYQGEYHLFYQFYPYKSEWGPMHWGHSKSKDLVHWEELPTALSPDEDYDKDGCFSGSAVEKDGKLYLMYTGHKIVGDEIFQTQCIAVSEDGINFVKHEKNPVIGEKEIGNQGDIHDFRDPKVIEKDGTYYSVIASKTKDDRGLVLLYQSKDLYEWEFFSVLLEGTEEQGVMWECPDVFHLDGKDVLIMSPIKMKPKGVEYLNTSSTAVFIGEINWETGVLSVENHHEIDHGLDFYAPQTTIDTSGRRIMVAWMQMWGRTIPSHELGHGWASSMTLPRELRIKNNRLYQKPVSDIYENIKKLEKIENIVVNNEKNVYRCNESSNLYYHLEMDISQTNEFQICFAEKNEGGLNLRFEKETGKLTFSREKYGYLITGSEPTQLNERQLIVPLDVTQLEIEVFMDTSSVEIFVNQEKTMTFTFYEVEKSSDLIVKATGSLKIDLLEIGSVVL